MPADPTLVELFCQPDITALQSILTHHYHNIIMKSILLTDRFAFLELDRYCSSLGLLTWGILAVQVRNSSQQSKLHAIATYWFPLFRALKFESKVSTGRAFQFSVYFKFESFEFFLIESL